MEQHAAGVRDRPQLATAAHHQALRPPPQPTSAHTGRVPFGGVLLLPENRAILRRRRFISTVSSFHSLPPLHSNHTMQRVALRVLQAEGRSQLRTLA